MNVGNERTQSLWMQTEAAPQRPSLEGSLRCDTVIVGAGIAGLSVAYELAFAGQMVTVLDRGEISRGMTARTTASARWCSCAAKKPVNCFSKARNPRSTGSKRS